MNHLPIIKSYFQFPVSISFVQMLVLCNRAPAGYRQFMSSTVIVKRNNQSSNLREFRKEVKFIKGNFSFLHI